MASKKTRCWKGYKPTPGKKPYSPGSCEKISEAYARMAQAYLVEKDENNPWAICTAQVGRKDKAKYERCVKSVKRQDEGDAWTKKEGQSPSGGLNAKGRASLKSKGQNIKAPVTEKNPKGKRKARRKSFCARMSGMPGPMRDSKGRPTRKAASLRRWGCRR